VPKGEKAGRCLSCFEIEEILHNRGYIDCKFYLVFFCLKVVQFLFSDNYQINAELPIRYTPLYRNPDTVFVNEEKLFADIDKMGMLKQLANSYLIECTFDEHHTSIKVQPSLMTEEKSMPV